ncbi:gamma-crystallin M2-like [Sinocyclocheilus anshuiensis]|uniref:Gamma-crystallin M2-like n=1 Tax=Sinocyclocheilus anshuiensis TaxID=1608454 RepID=A0A671KFF2_9TELE|nr:PREDICTED: gamma-crystallin M2-like [Sinocyclocheilus anshuiensis]
MTIGKIIFYEDRNFQGRYHECSSDCADLHPYFTQCNSIRVDSGCFMVYEHPNYMGQQYFLRKGEYSDCQRMIGFSNCIRSCRMIPMYAGNYRMRLYDRADMGGQMVEVTEDCPNIMDRFHTSDIHSCHVMDGHWLLYEQPNYRGRMYYLGPGEYKKYSDWGGTAPRIRSLRRITSFN